MQPIAIYNYKGGVGKSTIAVNLAEAAADAKQSACAVDCDPQCTTSFYMLGTPKVVEKMKNLKTIRKMMNWIGTNDKLPYSPKGLLISVPNWRAKLICGDMTLTELEMQMVLKGIGEAQRIWQALFNLNDTDAMDQHWPIIDCSPSYSFFTIAATFCASGGIFIPVTTEEDSFYGITLSARAIQKVAAYIKAAPKILPKCGKIKGIICNRVEPKQKSPLLAALKFSVDVSRSAYPDSFDPDFKILDTILPEDPQIPSIRANHRTLKSYAPGSSSAKSYDMVYEEIKSLLS